MSTLISTSSTVHSLPFSLQSIQLLGSLLTVEEVCVNLISLVDQETQVKLTLTLAGGLKGSQTEPDPGSVMRFYLLQTTNTGAWSSLVETDLSWSCLTTSIRVTCYHNGPGQCQARQLIKHQNRHFLLADGRRRLPVCPGHNYQRIPVFLSPVSLNTHWQGLDSGQWRVETDNPGAGGQETKSYRLGAGNH